MMSCGIAGNPLTLLRKFPPLRTSCVQSSGAAIMRTGLLLFLAIGTWAPAYAERYAVLAGVGEYESGIRSLEGPREDIRALHDALLEQGYIPTNVTVLLNSSATKHNILGALDRAVARLKPGDHLFFYFSGHGTSAFDENSREISPLIGPDSGGLLPVDLDLNSVRSIADTLVIGRRDLRPILSRVPAQAQAFVVLDSCYSENSAKAVGLWSSATPRTVQLTDLVKDRSSGTHVEAKGVVLASAANEPYPYSNVVSLAAAAKTQTAMDISSAQLRQGVHTVDDKPHGALTNTLLVGLTGRADTNHDGKITYDELFRFVRREMEKYPQQPQMLAPPSFALDQAVLGSARVSASGSVGVPAAVNNEVADKVRVKLGKPDPDFEGKLRAIPDVQIVPGGSFDVLVQA